MLGSRHRSLSCLGAAAALASLSACCKNGSPLHPQTYDCTQLTDWCTAGADAGQSGACADHTYCDPIHKDDPDHSNTDAVAASCRKCYFESRTCATNADCCPGQECAPAPLNVCQDCYNLDSTGACGPSGGSCTSDQACSNTLGPGHVCVLFNSPDGGPPQIPETPPSAPNSRCSYPTCKQDSDCQQGATCFPEGATPYGYCVFQAPCNGPCAAGSACTITDDLCSEVPAGKANCQQSCPAGSMLVFKDESVPTGVYDACNLPAVDCDCATLPPIHSDDLGRYSSLGAQGGQIWVSAYDGQYGDLVAYHFSPDGGLLDLEYVDGVPDGGAVVANPTGPRGGIAAPGPNVGEWTSLVLGSDGQPRISYYDVDHKALKYAQRQSSGSWTVGWVDGWDGTGADGGGADVGSYTSIGLDKSGNPAIAYFQAAGPSATAPLQTAVKLAIATKANPASPADWTLTVVDSADRPAPPCFPVSCKSGEVCVGSPPVTDGGPLHLSDGGCAPYAPPDNGGSCMATSTQCGSGDAGCASGDACVANDAGAASCQPTFAATEGFNDLPLGIGLFTSLAFDSSGNPIVAYYDRLHGDLRLATSNGSGFTVTTIDGTDPATCDDTGDVGYFPSLQLFQGTMAVAYQDGTDHELLYWTGAVPSAVAPNQRIVVDTGTMQAPAPNNGEDTPMFAGANVTLRFGAGGTAYFAYQNQTQISLRLASEPPNCTTPVPSLCNPAIVGEWAADPEGFYAQLAIDGANGWLSSAQIKALVSGVDNQLLLEGPVPAP
ncbi:MAG: hypothetical protein ACYDCL_05385 [Myxococcales bacterium]